MESYELPFLALGYTVRPTVKLGPATFPEAK